ncbi:hypothetical protein EfsSzw1_179 [Enterococcus phage EfsSzw-1]|uniref:Uncharacterized protein n=1 Tax=Enterococcus phage EfsSzw-1 TaxID=2419745 RepID=A0A411B7Q0_9CAUD|nr:hypothetical protein EfsSzw1_179 [Enterococcus phage EfsSzw-1]
MNEIMNYVWLGVFIAIPVIGFIYVYNHNRKHQRWYLRKSYWAPLVLDLVVFGIWLGIGVGTLAVGHTETTVKTFDIEPLTVYSSPENTYAKIGATNDSYVNFVITGKGVYSIPLKNTNIHYVKSEEAPKATVTYYKLDSNFSAFMGMQGELVTKKTRVDIQVPIGGVEVSNTGSTFKEQSINDLLK